MELRKALGAAAVVAATAMMVSAGCSGRDEENPEPGNPGCTGVCSQDAGFDAGVDAGVDSGVDAGTDAGSNTGPTIAEIRKLKFATPVTLHDVVITSIEYEKLSDQNGKDFRSRFWVTDPARPTEGIFVDKFYSDTPVDYHPAVGDKIDVEGFVNTDLPYEQFRAYRQKVVNDFKNSKILKITLKEKASRPADNVVTVQNLKDAMQASGQADAGYAGTRVHLTGDIAMTNPTPAAFARVDAPGTDGGPATFYGFEVADGILVNHVNTRDQHLSDGGTVVRCDWQAAVSNGGTVRFPNGISGVWDTYSFSQCDGTDSNTDVLTCHRQNGSVPGSTKKFTYVIYPDDCGDVVGEFDAGTPP
ncbi:hypothetical protein JGU66_20965 [Myxococcaceae bacterium JPH2]|nr:hypothetical protein [Myxococcaceae bacterium JPH2]